MAAFAKLASPSLSLPRKGVSRKRRAVCPPPPSIPPHKGEGGSGGESRQQVSLPLVGREQGWGDSPTIGARHG